MDEWSFAYADGRHVSVNKTVTKTKEHEPDALRAYKAAEAAATA